MKSKRVGAPTGIPRLSPEKMLYEGTAINFAFDARRNRDVVTVGRPMGEMSPINDTGTVSIETKVKKW